MSRSFIIRALARLGELQRNLPRSPLTIPWHDDCDRLRARLLTRLQGV
jgi:hypothetical protein